MALLDFELDREFAVNVVHFWPDPKPFLQEIRRVLKLEGKLSLAFLGKEAMQRQLLGQTEVFKIFSADQIVDLL